MQQQISRTHRILAELSRRYAPVFTRPEVISIAATEARRFGGRVVRGPAAVLVEVEGERVLKLVHVGRNRWQQENLVPSERSGGRVLALLKRLEGKYTPVYSTARMRAIVEHEAAARNAAMHLGSTVAQLKLPTCGSVLRFRRMGRNRWQPENVSPRCVR